MPPVPEDADLAQSFTVPDAPHAALDAAQVYLEGAGMVTAALRGRMERFGDSLAVHHGRIRTVISVKDEPGGGTRVRVHRSGTAPLEGTRSWLVAVGLAGFIIAWAISIYNQKADVALAPLVTITLFFLGILAVIVLLYVVDKSLEKRSASLVLSLEDAMRGDPLEVLQRELDLLERANGLTNGILFYCAALFAEFIIFVILLSDGIRQGIDEVVTLEVMRVGFLLPIAPAAAFGLLYWLGQNKVHARRLQDVAQRFPVHQRREGSEGSKDQ